jgi:hypothetical protein
MIFNHTSHFTASSGKKKSKTVIFNRTSFDLSQIHIEICIKLCQTDHPQYYENGAVRLACVAVRKGGLEIAVSVRHPNPFPALTDHDDPYCPVV